MDQRIKDAYYDPKTGFVDSDKLYKKLKDKGFDVTLEEVEEVVGRQLTDQVYRPIGKFKRKYNPITSPSKMNNLQVDLLDMSTYSKFNKGFKWLMNGIDVYTRYAYSVPMKTKNEGDILKAFRDMVDVMGVPKNLNTDLEAGMMGKKFQDLMRELGIKHYKNDPNLKRNNALVERVNRTFREKFQKYFYSHDTSNWLNVLPDILENYNTTFHSGIKAVPKEVWDGKATPDQKKADEVYPSGLKVGDKVRMLKERSSIFRKGTQEKNWTKNIYTIKEIQGKTFIIENAKGVRHGRKDFELLKVEDPDVIEDNENKIGNQGTRKEFKEEVKQQQAERRLRKEDIDSDLKDTTPAAPKRVPVTRTDIPKPSRRKATTTPNPQFKDGDKVSVQYPDRRYNGEVIKANPKSVVVFFPEDNSRATLPESKYKLIRKRN